MKYTLILFVAFFAMITSCKKDKNEVKQELFTFNGKTFVCDSLYLNNNRLLSINDTIIFRNDTAYVKTDGIRGTYMFIFNGQVISLTEPNKPFRNEAIGIQWIQTETIGIFNFTPSNSNNNYKGIFRNIK